MVVFQPTSGIQQHLVLLSPCVCGVVNRATTDLEVVVPGGGSLFVGPPRLLDRVSSRVSPINSEDNLSSNKDEEDPTGEVPEVIPTGINLRLEGKFPWLKPFRNFVDTKTRQSENNTPQPLDQWTIAHSLANRLENVRGSHCPNTWPIYLPCTVAQGQSHCASNIISNSYPFHSKWVDPPIPELQQFQYFN